MFRIPTPVTRVLATATFLGAVALAVPSFAAPATDAAPTVATAHVSHIDRVETRISGLRSLLRITPAQEAQWTIVAQSMRDNAKAMDALIKERSSNAKTMTAVDDLHSYEKLAEAHEAGLKTFIPVFETLYSNMSDDQKKAADSAFRSHGSKHMHKKS
jgi:hypothetical protein